MVEEEVMAGAVGPRGGTAGAGPEAGAVDGRQGARRERSSRATHSERRTQT